MKRRKLIAQLQSSADIAVVSTQTMFMAQEISAETGLDVEIDVCLGDAGQALIEVAIQNRYGSVERQVEESHMSKLEKGLLQRGIALKKDKPQKERKDV